MFKIIKTGIFVIIVVGLLVGCSDFLENPDVEQLQNDPNRATEVHPDQLFQGVQIQQFFTQEGGLSRIFAIWMQQMAGTDRQLQGYARYEITAADNDVEFNDTYNGGGLIDIRNIITMTTERGWTEYRGIAKVWEALVIGTAASIWGDIPYSEACSDVLTPKLDEQVDVYAALQSLLDDAIADLQSGTGGYIPPNDWVYGGDLGKWIEAAHSLKARFYMHWAEVDAGNYGLALAQAQQGISSIENSFKSKHSDVERESHPNYQFFRERDSYIRAGAYLVDLLKARSDPRLSIYFGLDANGEYRGGEPGVNDPDASNLSDIFLAKDFSGDIISYEETQMIIAEAAFHAGDRATAFAALNDMLAANEIKWALDANSLPRYDDASVPGNELFEKICEEKYIATFLNIEIYNDWKRTKRPILVPYGGGDPETTIPHRIPYSDDEQNANPNIPEPAQQPSRNDNDPN